MAKKHMKTCSPSLAIKETTLRFHLTRVRIVTSITPSTPNVGEDVGEKIPSHTAGGNVS
jgi:hypothetical protein